MTQALEKVEHTGTALTPADMIEKALSTGSGPEVMEKLLALQERWEAMQAKKAFDNAMAKLRENMPKIIKLQTVDYQPRDKPRVNYKYEALTDVTEPLAPVMSALGLSFRWRTESGKDGVKVTCIIAHRDGHSEETSLTANADVTGGKNAIQAIGSAVTYLQRYTLKAAVGVAADYDDDAQRVTPQETEAPAKPSASKGTEARALYTQAEFEIRRAGSVDDLKRIWENTPWDDIPTDWHTTLVEEKNARIKALSNPQTQVSASQSLESQFPGDLPAETVEAGRNLQAG